MRSSMTRTRWTTTVVPARSVAAALALLIAAVGQGWAGTIPVVNGSFETPVVVSAQAGSFTGWTVTGDGGVQNPAHYGNLLPAYDGVQDAYLHNGASMTQTVGSYDGSSTYTLTYHAGMWSQNGQYEVSLLVGNTVLASYTSLVIPVYTWDTVTTLVAPPNPGLSGSLTIQFSYVAGYETDIDAVSLTSSAVPEPSSLVLAGVAALAGLVSWSQGRKPV